MNVTLRQLQIFAVVAEHLSFTRAAAVLHLTQPAVSIQVRQLEEQTGLPLFEQVGKKTYLTEAGKELLRYSRVIAQQLEEAEQVLAELKGVARGRLQLAVASTANYFAPRLLSAFCQQYPQATISLDVTNRQALLAHLADNRMDLVIMGQPPAELDLVSEPFMDNPLVAIAAPDHPGVGHTMTLSELATTPFVVREEGSGTRAAMERFFAKHGIAFTTGMEMTSNEAIKQAVVAGLGFGVVSLHTLELELLARRLAVLEVAQFPIMRRWYVVHRQGKRLSPLAAAFKSFLIREAATLWPLAALLALTTLTVPALPAPQSAAGE